MKIETKINPRDLKKWKIKLTTNIQEWLQGRGTPSQIKEKTKGDKEKKEGTETTSEPTGKTSYAGVLNAGTIDETAAALEAISAIPELNKGPTKGVIKSVKGILKVYKATKKVISIYQKVAPKVTKVVKIVGMWANPANGADLAKDAIGFGIKLIIDLIRGSYEKLKNMLLTYPIVLEFDSEKGFDIDIFKSLITLFENMIEEVCNLFAYYKEELRKFCKDVGEAFEGGFTSDELYNFIMNYKPLSEKRRELLILTKNYTIPEIEKMLGVLDNLAIDELLKELTSEQVVKLFEMLAEMTNDEIIEFLNNIKKLELEDLLKIFNELETTDVNYIENIKSRMEGLLRQKEEDIKKSRDDFMAGPFGSALNVIPLEYLENFSDIICGYDYKQRWSLIAYLQSKEIPGITTYIKHQYITLIIDSVETDFQTLKIMLLSIIMEKINGIN